MTRRSLLLGALLAPAFPAAAQFTPTPLATVSGTGRFGQAVVPIGDLDGNGVGDYAIGRPLATVDGKDEAGSVRIQFMTTSTTAGSTVDLNPGTLLSADNFGAALAVLSPAPALRLLVGTPGFYGVGDIAASGRVYVLSVNSAGAITATDTIDDTDLPLEEGDNFGASLAVLTQGTTSTFLVGAPESNCTAGLDCGSVVAISYTGTTATVVSRIGGAGGPNITQSVLGIAAGDQFGRGLASPDGSTAFVGAPFADAGGTDRGRVYAGTVDNTGTLVASAVLDGSSPLLASLANGAQFGYAIAARQGSPVEIAVGAPGTNSMAGAVWALTYASNAFTDADASTTTPAVGSLYGAGVALPSGTSYSGIDLLVGAPGAGTVNLTETSGALPVELTAFTAVADGGRLTLRWTTASETNNAGFHIEAQAATGVGTPETAWRSVAFVPGAGTTSEARTYTLPVPPSLAPGRTRFRLVQQDIDGARHAAAETEAVVGLDGPVALSASPNPSRAGLAVRAAVRDAQRVRVGVYDALGREVARLYDGPMDAGQGQTWRLEAGALAAGSYFVRLDGEAGLVRSVAVSVVR